RTGFGPGFLVGGLPRSFPRSFRGPGPRRLPTPESRGRKRPFVIEGDEYDTAFFEKTAKFLHYRPEVAIITSIEHDHIDIYPSLAAYLEAFERFVTLLPEDGLLVANAADPLVRSVAEKSRAEVAFFALEGEDTGGVAPHWLAAPALSGPTGTAFDLFAGGMLAGRFATTLPGRHNIKNAVAAIAAAAQGFGARLKELGTALGSFEGVRRRQELLGSPGGVAVYDDFAHHPTAVRETLDALRARHPSGRLIAVFEPRSATACRKLHQSEYPRAFGAADLVLFAPLGRTNLSSDEMLDLDRVVEDIRAQGKHAERCSTIDAVGARVKELAKPGDIVALLSNGAFGGLPRRLATELSS
ncbi:MAG TPA: Mur ligase family protein, partial [Polyangiaceae bacterium]|nr:Mur ligase family protein [Polyangiaceae bacterium]